MHVSFHNEYIAAVVVFTVLLLCCNSLNVCVCSVLAAFQPCLHAVGERVHDCLTSDLGKWAWVCFILYSLLQPLIFVMALPVASFMQKRDLASSVQIADAHLVFGNGTNATLLLDTRSAAVDVDTVLVILPFACVSCLSTTLWLKLQNVGIIEKNDAWDEGLFERAEMWAYENCFYAEVFLGSVAALLVAAQAPQLGYIVYLSFAIASLNVFFSTVARFSNREAHGALMLAAAWGMLGVAHTTTCLCDINWSEQRSGSVAVVWLMASVLLACMHAAAAGTWPADAVIQARMLVSLGLSFSLLGFMLTDQ